MTKKKEKKIIIVDYGVGNIGSVKNALDHLGYTPILSKNPEEIATAEVIVLPGQGAFETAMRHLKEAGVIDVIKAHIHDKKPFLGICVGFQVLFEQSEEMGSHEGLGVFPGTLKKFPDSELTIPHMGWNDLQFQNKNPYEKKLGKDPQVYFVHSYYLENTDPEVILATCDYGTSFVAAIQNENLLATQFHPEKSGKVGMKLLRSFLEKS